MKWENIKLDELSDVIMGNSPPGSEYNQNQVGLPLITGAGQFGELTPKPTQYSKSGSRIVNKGDLIVCVRATIGDLNWADRDYYLGRGVAGIKPKADLESRYLWHYIHTQAPYFERNSTGSTFRQIKKDVLTETLIPLPFKNGKPDLDEQKRIAAILDKADAIRRKRRQALQLTDDFLRSLFLDMFGDPVTNPKGWPVKLSSDLFSDKPRIGTTRPAKGSGYIVVRVGELGKTNVNFERCGRVELSNEEFKRFELLPGDTVIARAIGSKKQLGKASYFTGYKEAVVIDSHVMRLRPDPTVCNPIWFYLFLTSQGGLGILQKAGGETAVQFNINGSQANTLNIPLPPMDLQLKIEKLWLEYQENQRRQIQSLASVNDLFASLQQRAFKGEL